MEVEAIFHMSLIYRTRILRVLAREVVLEAVRIRKSELKYGKVL
jgi:hypothetical protein